MEDKKLEGVRDEPKEIVVVDNSPAAMIREAVKDGADLEKLEKLLDLQIRWEQNEAKKLYHEAMTQFKADPPKIDKDKQVAYKEVKYRHASLANVVDKVNEALSKYGLSASWITHQNGQICVTCKITHVKGHSEQTTLCAASDTSGSKNAIQAIGSTVSYLQRYTLLSLTGLATHDMDDDGNLSTVEYITESQAADLAALIEETKTDKAKLLLHLKVESLDKIESKDYKKVCVILEARRGGKK